MPQTLADPFRTPNRQRINRAPSPVLALALPWVLVMLGSLTPLLPLIASAPVVPPFGFLLLLGWQQLRPGVFPVWAGLPLGLFDDLYSGQPLGSAVVLWSTAMIALDVIEVRFPWRGFVHNWLVATAFIAGYLLIGLWLANLIGEAQTPLAVIGPQLVIAILSYPVAERLVGLFDRLRLLRIKAI